MNFKVNFLHKFCMIFALNFECALTLLVGHEEEHPACKN